MRMRISSALFAVALLGAALPALASLPDFDFSLPEILPLMDKVLPQTIPGRYVVLLKEGVNPQDVVAQQHVRSSRLYAQLRGFSGALSEEQRTTLLNDPRVLMVEPDIEMYAFAVKRSSQVLPTGVNRAEADRSATAAINGVDERVNADIAIIDTGVQRTHPDLQVVNQVNFSTDFSTDDQNGHGTHVAGTAAAKDNTVGVVGMAPGARIWSVKVLNRQGSGYLSDIIAGIDYVTAHASEIEVANMSLGCECQSEAMDEAISRSVAAGVVYVVAAGNSGKDAATFSPANHPDVLAVSAIADFNGLPGGGARATCRSDVDDTFADFSNYGAVVDIAAPGVCINSTWKMSRYDTISGTSMASPHVAGAVALYLSTHQKPTDAAGVASVRASIIAAGTPQSDSNGFTGDRDAFAEPLLNVESF
ncbi:MAG: S8 family serine peptidase [Candidatus Peregrinibacteria bacterium]